MIKFVSYDGKYPNLCSGTLTIDVDGEKMEIQDALTSGGCVWFDDDWNEHVESGAWAVNDLPDWAKPHREEIETLVNENIPFGCCGGCI